MNSWWWWRWWQWYIFQLFMEVGFFPMFTCNESMTFNSRINKLGVIKEFKLKKVTYHNRYSSENQTPWSSCNHAYLDIRIKDCESLHTLHFKKNRKNVLKDKNVLSWACNNKYCLTNLSQNLILPCSLITYKMPFSKSELYFEFQKLKWTYGTTNHIP